MATRMHIVFYRQSLSGLKPLPQVITGKKLSHSKSETTAKGSMIATSQRGQPSHYTLIFIIYLHLYALNLATYCKHARLVFPYNHSCYSYDKI